MERNAANEHEARMRKAAQYLAARDAARKPAGDDDDEPSGGGPATSAFDANPPAGRPGRAEAGGLGRAEAGGLGRAEPGQEGRGPRGGAGGSLSTDRAAQADAAVRDAIARGEFDNLSLAGKPIPGLGQQLDPDWWVKGLIEREKLTGLAPEPFLLRTEDATLDQRLDALYTEQQVREVLVAFNRRVIEARRQLLGGPPVVTPVRDVDLEVRRWHERRSARRGPAPAEASNGRGQGWWRRLWARVWTAGS
jgi:Domain of unknown function (DUF1992)